MEIKDKITIKEKESTPLATTQLHAQLRWKKAIDLDLYALYETKDNRRGRVYFADRGSRSFIYLDQDAGIGDKGGDNVENIYFAGFNNIKRVLILANIYGKQNAVFASFDGEVSVKSGDKEIIVPLTSKEKGSWCAIALFDNTTGTPQLTNINETLLKCPSSIDAILSGNVVKAEENKGFFQKLFGG